VRIQILTRASYFSPKSLGPRIDCRGNEALPLGQTGLRLAHKPNGDARAKSGWGEKGG
jgi:hypothetical protein